MAAFFMPMRLQYTCLSSIRNTDSVMQAEVHIDS